MAFNVPRHVPSFDSSQRQLEDTYWRAANTRRNGQGGGVGANISEKFNTFFDPNRDLPMYKDKPYLTSRRGGTKRKRLLLGTAALAFLTLTWWLWGGRGGEQADSTNGGLKGKELWQWVKGSQSDTGSEQAIDWNARRERVKDAFVVSWDGYEKYAWGFDEYHPISKKGRNMIKGGMGWIIVDALDTMMIMNLTTQVQNARNWIHNSLRYDQDAEVNTFETTIRMLGGLLSAHYLSTTYPELAPLADDDEGAPGEDLYIEKATDLANRLMGAFESPSGIPYASVNLNTSQGVPSHADGGASSTAEAATLQLEFKYLAKITGEPNYWEIAEEVIKVIDDNAVPDGLVPIFIYAHNGEFRGDNIRLGSRGDSYYEYLIKQYLQTSKGEPIYLEMWDEAMQGIRKHLITYTKNAKLTVLGELQSGIGGKLSPKMDHLVCFMPGTIALGATGGLPLAEAKKSAEWTRQKDEEIHLAKELMKTCWATYLYTKTGLAPEITYFEIDDPPLKMDDYFSKTAVWGRPGQDIPLISEPLHPIEDPHSPWRRDIDVHSNDVHNLQRPETVESLYYMYRITGDEIYRHWGWDMFRSFIQHTAVVEKAEGQDADPEAGAPIVAFTSLGNANVEPPVQRDNMESFWLAETLKYFYLLFSDREFLPLEKTVLNTEAHIFPRFEMGELFKTGWQRKPRVETAATGPGKEGDTPKEG